MTALALLIPCGILHGLWTDRWGVSDEPAASVARLARLPLTVGEWDGREIETDPREGGAGKVAGHVLRRYENRRTGGAVSVLLVCGRPGPVAVHTPEVCYGGAGYDLAAAPVRYVARPEPSGRPGEFWEATFHRRDAAGPVRLRILWAWNAAGAWEAPDNPRLAFARFPALYKVYVLRETASSGEEPGEEPCKEFLRRLLPELETALFPAS